MMLADRAVLASTLVVAFASGGAAGFAVNGGARPAAPYAVETVFREQIQDLRQTGYDDAEVAEAVEAYSAYLSEYQKWWDAFVESHGTNLDRVDEKLRLRLADIEAQRRERKGASGK